MGSGKDPGTSSGRRTALRLGMACLFVIALLVLRFTLPVGEWLTAFNTWVGDLGATGMLVFVCVYVLAAVLFVPGSVLTVGAGLLFGLFWGTAVVSAGSTLGASAAFLISKYLARDWVLNKAQDNRKFSAIDRAIGKEGGKMIFLLRLSPAIPFNVSNYLYGLTAVRFVPYVLASWVGMLPGTVLYVYLGTLGKAGIEASAGSGGTTLQEWVLRVVGLLATAAVTVYITRTARKALAESELESAGEPV